MVDDELLCTLERELERLGADELDSYGEEQRRVLLWRARQFSELGFDEAACVAIAAAPVDLGRARALIGSGCPHETASRILL